MVPFRLHRAIARLRASGARAFCLVAVVASAACSAATDSTTAVRPDSGFQLVGNPEATVGAHWTYRGTVDGVSYDLQGVLFKPPGQGPFPAVVLSHASDGNAEGYGVALGSVMVQWGLVCIATDYTHSTGVPIGSPGTAAEPGASAANILRAHRAYELLRALGYVDMTRVAAHGHSMGAYVTAALVGAYPADFRVASHTGGGVRPAQIVIGPAPGPTAVQSIRIPYQLHHGGDDATVPLSYEQRLDSILGALAVPHELYVYPGQDHVQPSRSPEMLQHVRDWYVRWGVLD